MEYLQIDVYDLTVFDENNNQVAHFDKLFKMELNYNAEKEQYDLVVKNAFLHTEYLKFIGEERVLTDFEKSLGGKKLTVSIKKDEGKRCKLIAKSIVYDPQTNKKASDIIIEIPHAVTSLKPDFTGESGEAYCTLASFKVLADPDNGNEFFKIHI